jgi:hypothetical protein
VAKVSDQAIWLTISISVIVIDHRFVGLSAGAIALYFKRSFLTVMVIAGATGSLFYNVI